MLTIGVDAHKRVHVAVALDAVGREGGRCTARMRPRAGGSWSPGRPNTGAPGRGASRVPGGMAVAWPSTRGPPARPSMLAVRA